MVHLMEVRANLAIDQDYYHKQHAAAQNKTPAPKRLPQWIEKHWQVMKAKERAKEAGRPFPEKLSFKVIQDICQGRL
jgi:hypothetical protein